MFPQTIEYLLDPSDYFIRQNAGHCNPAVMPIWLTEMRTKGFAVVSCTGTQEFDAYLTSQNIPHIITESRLVRDGSPASNSVKFYAC